MKYELEIKHEAFLDIKETYLYYEGRKKGLGKRFLDCLENYMKRLQEYPEHYQIKRTPYREVFIKDFPYLIIFEIEQQRKVIVYAVFNTSRNPAQKPHKK